MPTLSQRLAAETLGTLLLVGTVIGSGILADRLSADDAVSLLGNTIATGAILAVLILSFGPVSGAHFNPAVTVVMAIRRELPVAQAMAYILAQCAGGVLGAMLAHTMFDLPAIQIAANDRSGFTTAMSDGVATFALVLTILAVRRSRPEAVAYAVALVITAGYWWTASTSFANPAVTLARAFSDTFAGIRPVDAPGFVVAQLAGAVSGLIAYAAVFPRTSQSGSAGQAQG